LHVLVARERLVRGFPITLLVIISGASARCAIALLPFRYLIKSDIQLYGQTKHGPGVSRCVLSVSRSLWLCFL